MARRAFSSSVGSLLAGCSGDGEGGGGAAGFGGPAAAIRVLGGGGTGAVATVMSSWRISTWLKGGGAATGSAAGVAAEMIEPGRSRSSFRVTVATKARRTTRKRVLRIIARFSRARIMPTWQHNSLRPYAV
jgi:hypothetical protein